MLDESSQLRARYGDLDRELSTEFPEEAVDALIGYLERYQAHLRTGTEVMSRSEYMDLLQRSARATYSFLGCSRTCARALLWGKYGHPKWWQLSREKVAGIFRLVLLNVFPIIIACITLTYRIDTYLLSKIKSPHMLRGAFFVVMTVLFCVWVYYVYQEYRKKTPWKSISLSDARRVHRRFVQYNEELNDRAHTGYPTTRLFVLEPKEIEKDDQKINRKMNKSWWQVMVELHAKHNIEVARISLTDKLKAEFPDLAYQFSIFTTPGRGGWAIVLEDEHLPRVVRVGMKGKTDVYRRFSTLCANIRGFAERYVADENEGIRESRKRIHDISRCLSCPEEGDPFCVRHKIECERTNQ